jgi:hypothetical protein
MTFFARPNLSDEQFKQLSGTTLTLSGQTKIVNANGLAIADGSGNTIQISAKGAAIGRVLTYDAGTNEIKFSAPSSGASTGIYTGLSPSTCTVGGMPAGTSLSGVCITSILQCILVPTLNPTVNPPAFSYSISPINGTCCEVGSSVSITGCLVFNRGCIFPQYCGTSQYRSGLPTIHKYMDISGTTYCCVCTALSGSLLMPSLSIHWGNNTTSGSVCYASGTTNVFNSAGVCICAALPAGVTAVISQVICGLYPYFYGKVASGGAPAGGNRPTANLALVTGGTKVVADSTGTISINFNSTADDYIWFATPYASVTKTCWYIDALNNAGIGGAVSPGGNLFPNNTPVSPVSTILWGGQCYKVYISNYQSSSTSIMQLRNS